MSCCGGNKELKQLYADLQSFDPAVRQTAEVLIELHEGFQLDRAALVDTPISPEQAIRILDAFKNYKKQQVHSLAVLRGWPLHDATVLKRTVEWISEGITTLSIHHEGIGAEQGAAFATGLANVQNFTIHSAPPSLASAAYYAGTAPGQAGLRTILDALSSERMQTFEYLTLLGTPLGDLIDPLCALVRNNKCPLLRELRIMESRLCGTDYVARLATAMKHNNTINSLCVSRVGFNTLDHSSECGLDANGAIALADLLRSNSNLRYLLLGSNNRIGTTGVEALAAALAPGINSQLLHLSLDGCGLNSAAIGHLIEMLKINVTLRSLSLRSNNISEEDGAKLEEVMRKTNRTCALVVTNNRDIQEVDKEAINVSSARNIRERG